MRANVELVLLSLAFFDCRDCGGLVKDALRFVELGCSIPLDDRSKLIAAIADPFDSCSACVVNSSRVSESAHDCHAWTSLERPRASRGGNEFVNAEIGGSVILGRALWLRDRPNLGLG